MVGSLQGHDDNDDDSPTKWFHYDGRCQGFMSLQLVSDRRTGIIRLGTLSRLFRNGVHHEQQFILHFGAELPIDLLQSVRVHVNRPARHTMAGAILFLCVRYLELRCDSQVRIRRLLQPHTHTHIDKDWCISFQLFFCSRVEEPGVIATSSTQQMDRQLLQGISIFI